MAPAINDTDTRAMPPQTPEYDGYEPSNAELEALTGYMDAWARFAQAEADHQAKYEEEVGPGAFEALADLDPVALATATVELRSPEGATATFTLGGALVDRFGPKVAYHLATPSGHSYDGTLTKPSDPWNGSHKGRCTYWRKAMHKEGMGWLASFNVCSQAMTLGRALMRGLLAARKAAESHVRRAEWVPYGTPASWAAWRALGAVVGHLGATTEDRYKDVEATPLGPDWEGLREHLSAVLSGPYVRLLDDLGRDPEVPEYNAYNVRQAIGAVHRVVDALDTGEGFTRTRRRKLEEYLSNDFILGACEVEQYRLKGLSNGQVARALARGQGLPQDGGA